MAVPADTLADSDGPLLEVVTPGPARASTRKLFSAIALFALINGCLLNLVMASRLMYGMAQRGGRPAGPRQGPRRPPDAVGGDPLHRRDRRRARRCSATSTTLAGHDRPAAAARLHRRPRGAAACCAASPSTTSTSRRLDRRCPWLGVATCAGLAVQQVVDDPEARPVGRRPARLRVDPVGDRARRAMIDAWHGTSPPTLSSRSSWTGCATSCATRSGRSRPSSTSSARTGFRRAIAPLQEQVKERGLWAAHLPPELGGQGFGQVKLGLMHEILGHDAVRARRVRQRRAGLRQQRDPRARGHAATRRSATCTRCSRATCAARSP